MSNVRNIFIALSILILMIGCSGSSSSRPAAKLYVGLFGENAVAVVDSGTGAVLSKIAVPTGPHGLVITPDGAKVYVSSDGATSVSVISTKTDAITSSIEVGLQPQGLAISPDGKQVLLSGWGSNEAIFIDTSTDQIARKVAVVRPHNSTFSRDGLSAFVGSQEPHGPSIALVTNADPAVTSSVALTAAPRALDYAASGRVYFTVAGADGLEQYDSRADKLGAAIPTGGSPHHMISTIDGAFELVVSQAAGDLEFVDPMSASVVSRVPTGKIPHWIALSSDGLHAFVSDEGSNDVAVVDLASRSVIRSIPVGMGPRKLAVQPMTN